MDTMLTSTKWIWISSILLCIVVFTEHLTPLGIAHAIAYVPVIAVAGLSLSTRVLCIIGGVALAMVWGAIFFSPPAPIGFPLEYVIANRILSSVGIIVVTLTSKILIVKKRSKKRLANQLKETSVEVSELIRSLPLIVWTTANDERIEFLNLGRTGNDQPTFALTYQLFLDAVCPDERSEVKEKWQKGMASQQRFSFTMKVQDVDKGTRTYCIEGVPVRPHNGNAMYWNGTILDITAQAQLQEKNVVTMQKLNATLAGITDAFFILDQNMRFIYANDKAQMILGCVTNEVQGRYLHDIISVMDDCPLIEKCYQAVDTQQVLSTTEYYPLHDMWVMQNIFPTEAGLTVYITDVSEAFKKERELVLLHAAVSKLNDIVLIAELDNKNPDNSKTIFVNDAFELKTGYRKADIIGNKPTLLCDGAEGKIETLKIRAQLARGKAVRTQVLNYTKQGQELWLDLDIVPITDEQGVYTHWVAVERDITHQKKLEAQLNRAQRMESIGFLTGGIAHDFNNLLTVYTGTTELLVEALNDDPELKNIAETALKAAERGKALTTSLLAFARKQSLNPTTFDVGEMLDNLMPLIRSSVGQKVNITVENKTRLQVTADLSQLENSVINLLVNARDAMPSGGEVTITVADKILAIPAIPFVGEPEPGHYVSIIVEDTGVGITDECKEHMFDPFFTTKAKGKGTGLGLSAVYGFIKQSKGHIQVESKVGVGTSIELCLPVAVEPTIKATQLMKSTVPVCKGKHILVVEDDKEVLDYVSARLKSVGYTVTVAQNATDALSLLQKKEFDLLFSDIVMPGELDGVQLAEISQTRWPGMPILLTSGFNDYGTGEQTPDKSRFSVLPKPYFRDELLQKLYDTLTG